MRKEGSQEELFCDSCKNHETMLMLYTHAYAILVIKF